MVERTMRYKKIGRNKWLKLTPEILEPFYFKGECDKDDKVIRDIPYEEYYEIVISWFNPNKAYR